MDSFLAIAASGLRSRMESLDMLAHNLANTGTRGYKADQELYTLYAAQAAGNDNGLSSTMPLIERTWTDFRQGQLQVTGNSLDIAIEGRGFIAVDSPQGVLYTRNGSLSVNSKRILVTEEGYPVRSRTGKPIQLEPGKDVIIQKDGTVEQENRPLGRIEIADFPSHTMVKQGDSYFRNPDATLKPDFSVTVTVHQGRLENSNVTPSDSAVRLVSVLRQFEMLQKAVLLSGEMNRKAIEEVAKAGA